MTAQSERLRLRVTVRGAVQGVGFRPFIYRLATGLGLTGWVNNSSQGVFIEVEGPRETLERFLLRIGPEKPPRAFIQSLESSFLDPVGYAGFEIRASDDTGEKTTLVLPDIATCPDCLADILTPRNRRYRYPFTNCTNCGPRFSIIQALPYDRPNTTMRAFQMCERCLAEYEDPLDRRFHAQPNACPDCGPHLELWDASGQCFAYRDDALLAAADAARRGAIVAVKGLGGFHLVVDARNEQSVVQLAQRKHREERPFALMYPSLESIEQDCPVSEFEERLLRSPEAPIVLLERRAEARVAPSVAPRNPYLGVMLPYTPLHHILLRELGFPVVATSGNLSDEPICTDEREALQRLAGIADLFLVHNRPIERHVDDSIVRVIMGREIVMRRARGYAPLPVPLKAPTPPMLAVGGHLKNTIAVSVGRQAFVSQHIGDLETVQAFDAFQRVIASFRQLYEVSPSAVACDMHPNYLSTQAAAQSGLPVVSVQHHYAHLLACMAENELEGPVLGVAWDGTGYGTDGTVWGGEFLYPTETSFERVGHLRTFRLPGGEAAVHEPRRAALGLLYEVLGDELFDRTDLAPLCAFSPQERKAIRTMLARGVNAPVTSSAGRLFDAMAAILGLRQVTRFEGQAAMELEYALAGVETEECYPFELVESGVPPDSHRRMNRPWQFTIGATRDENGGATFGKSPHSISLPKGERKSLPPKGEGQDAGPCGEPPYSRGHSAACPTVQAPFPDIEVGGTVPRTSVCGGGTTIVVDWAPMLREILSDVERHMPSGLVSARFHNTLAEAIVAVAKQVGQERVVLTGGCFQNRYLTERTVRRLTQEGFRPYWHQRIPPNDGGIALGQLVAASRQVGTAKE